MCLEANKFGKESPEKGVDIVCGKAMLLAQNLPVKVLNSSVNSGQFAREVNVRKCRLQFQHLEYGQQNQLEDILLSHARHPVASQV